MNRTFVVAWTAPHLGLFDPNPHSRHVPFLMTVDQACNLPGSREMLDELVKNGALIPLTVVRRDDVFALRDALNNAAETLLDSIPTVGEQRRPRLRSVPIAASGGGT